MRFLKTVFILLLGLVAWASATHVAVLETVADPSVNEKVKRSERQFLTNVLRGEAIKQLPDKYYTIMTRENIEAMLPPGKTIEDCEGTCLVETGRNIAADYVCQAHVSSFGNALSLSVELYETAKNNLVATINERGASVDELEKIIKLKAPAFFRKIRGNSTGFSDVGGISDVSSDDSFSFSGSNQFVVEIVTEPAGAVPTIDGKASTRCLSTPCKVQLEEGVHHIVASMDRYTDADVDVEIRANNQKVELTLEPKFGYLELKPALTEGAADRGILEAFVDGIREYESTVELDPGVHSVRLNHPCYNPVEFKVTIARNKTEVFDKKMSRGKGGLKLDAEYRNSPEVVGVFADGEKLGTTPYRGEVPLCAEIVLKGDRWDEPVDVELKWHETVEVTHQLSLLPEDEEVEEDDTRVKAEAAYDELDGKSGTSVDESVPANVENGKGGGAARWIVLGVSAAVAMTGAALAITGENTAVDAAERGGKTVSELEKNRDDAEFGQTLRGIGLGLILVGAIGVGVSFAF